jgi:hypothetical protein
MARCSIIRPGAKFLATAGLHRGQVVEILSASQGQVRFYLAHKHRRTDSGRWHGLNRPAFDRMFRPL